MFFGEKIAAAAAAAAISREVIEDKVTPMFPDLAVSRCFINKHQSQIVYTHHPWVMDTKCNFTVAVDKMFFRGF